MGLAVIIYTFLHCGYVAHCPLSKEGLYSINTKCCQLALLPIGGQCLSLHCHDVTEMDLVRTERFLASIFNPLTPNDHYSGRTAPLTSKCCILYIYSTNIGTEYFKHGNILSVFLSLQNAVLFHNSNVFGSCIIHIFIQGVLKFKKK